LGYCERSGIRGRTVTLKVKFANFRQITRSRTGQTQIKTRSELEELGNALSNPSFLSRKAFGSSVSHYLHSRLGDSTRVGLHIENPAIVNSTDRQSAGGFFE